MNLLIYLGVLFVFAAFAMLALFVTNIFLERVFSARAEQRNGYDRSGPAGLGNVVAEILKSKLKIMSHSRLPWSESALLWLWLGMSFVFLLFLVGNSGLLFLFASFSLGMALLQIVVLLSAGGEESMRMRNSLSVFALALLVLLISSLVSIVRVGSESLHVIVQPGDGMTIPLLVQDPALALAGVISLLSVVILVGHPPFGRDNLISFDGRRGLLLMVAQRMWAVSLLSYWIALFLGGVDASILGIAWLLVRWVLLYVLLLWVRVSVPVIRNADQMKFISKYLVPASLVALMAEICIVGFVA